MAITQLKSTVEQILRERGITGIDNVEVVVNGRKVVLSGVIDDPKSKRRCLDYCQHVVGVAQVVDQLRLKGDLDDNVGLKTNARKKQVSSC